MPTTVMAPPNRLTELRQRETRIQENLGTAADDFRYIRDEGLFHEDGYETWAEYCARKWGTTSDSLNRFIRHESTVDNISEVTPAGMHITAAAAEEIGDLPPDDQRAAAAQLPAVRKPSPTDMRKARADAGLPPKPRRRKLPKPPMQKLHRDNGEAENGHASGSPRIAQDASGDYVAYGPPGVLPFPETPEETWLQRFKGLCREFGELMRQPEASEIGESERQAVSEVLHGLAESVPWPAEVQPTPDAVESALCKIRQVVVEARDWTDSAAVAQVVDEFQKAIERLAPEKSDSDQRAVETADEISEVVAAWNATGNCECRELSPQRRTRIRRLLEDKFWRENWRAAIAKAEQCRDWAKSMNLGIDWFTQKNKVVELIEGRFDKMEPKGGKRPATRRLAENYGESGRL